jgi:hypothetical protein
VALAIFPYDHIDQAPLDQMPERSFDLGNSLTNSAFGQPPIGNSVDCILRLRVFEQVPQNLIGKRIARIGRGTFHGIASGNSSVNATSKHLTLRHQGQATRTKTSE